MIEIRRAKVYYSSEARRRFFTKSASIHAHARALMVKHFPSDKADENYGGGYYWEDDEYAVKLYRRLVNMIKHRMKSK
jgi:hypothetical protein